MTSDTDPAEALQLRAKQKMYLARYGRQSYIQWSDLEVTELDEAVRALSDLMKEENGQSPIERFREEHV